MDLESGKPLVADRASNHTRPVGEDELKGLSAYQDFIGSLDLENLGQQESPPKGGESEQ
jgi:hypothetical protein